MTISNYLWLRTSKMVSNRIRIQRFQVSWLCPRKSRWKLIMLRFPFEKIIHHLYILLSMFCEHFVHDRRKTVLTSAKFRRKKGKKQFPWHCLFQSKLLNSFKVLTFAGVCCSLEFFPFISSFNFLNECSWKCKWSNSLLIINYSQSDILHSIHSLRLKRLVFEL